MSSLKSPCGLIKHDLHFNTASVMYNVLSGLAACGRLGVAARASGVLFVTRRGTRRGTRRRARR